MTDGTEKGLVELCLPEGAVQVTFLSSTIAAELTPEQRERFERLQRENRIWWQAR